MNILVVGSLAYDYIMKFDGLFSDRILEDNLHKLSLSFLVEKLEKAHGGTAGNIAYSAKLLGANPLIFCPAGSDFLTYKKFLKNHKISTKYIPEYKEESMSSYFVVTDKKQNQIGSFYVGALKYAKDYSLKLVKEKINVAIISPTDPLAMKRAALECRNLNISYIYDPAFQIANFTREELLLDLSGASYLIGNDYEIGLLENKLELTHDELLSLVPVVIQTLGEKGSIIETISSSVHIKPAKTKKVLDPTGAGDAFRSGFLNGIVRGFSLDICGQMGSVNAAFVVEQNGTQKHYFTKGDFLKRYKENFLAQIKL